jgi:DNA processing protein
VRSSSQTAPAGNTASVRSWLSLCRVKGLSDAVVCRLVQTFGGPDAVRAASQAALMATADLTLAQARAIQEGPDSARAKEIDQELRAIERLGGKVISYLDQEYPSRLRTIPDPPPLLSITGELSSDDQYALAIVGSRKPTPAGRLLTEEISRDLAALGFTIVSGLARGIDGSAHRGAIRAAGRTIAVLGCGIDQTYPPEHEQLRREIEGHGAVISELPLGAHPHSYHFPRRNRIISGMSLGVLVTEAALQSGSLITARLAADQGREVFALPGFVKAENSRGPNGLIKQGAKLVETIWDIVDEVMPQLDETFKARLRERLKASTTEQPRVELNERERLIGDLISAQPIHIDEVILKSGFPAAEVAGLLVGLELRHLIHLLPGNLYIRI